MKWHEFTNPKALECALLSLFEAQLEEHLSLFGEAVVLLSGGSTPLGFYSKLHEIPIDWSKVSIGLVDERCVPLYSNESNYKCITENLHASITVKCKVHAMVEGVTNEDQNIAFANKNNIKFLKHKTIVLLGMGEDSHTASLFPGSKESANGLKAKSPSIISTISPQSPKHRITHNRASLLSTSKLILYIKGKRKKKVLMESCEDNTPISFFTIQENPMLNVYWTP